MKAVVCEGMNGRRWCRRKATMLVNTRGETTAMCARHGAPFPVQDEANGGYFYSRRGTIREVAGYVSIEDYYILLQKREG